MATAEQGVAFDEFVQGGLLDDADVTILGSRFSTWDYNGKQAPVFALKVTMTDDEGAQHEQYLSCGELRFFVPSTDGKKAVPVGTAQKLNLNTNAVAFLLSVMNADKVGTLTAALKASGDASLLEGLKVHVVRKAQPKRAGLAITAPGVEGVPQREKTQLLVEKIIAYAGGVAAPAGAAAPVAAAGAAAPAAAAPVSEVDDLAVGALCTLLGENGNSMVSTAIAGKFFSSPAVKAMELDPATKNKVLAVVVQPGFLGAAGRPWTFDAASKTVTMG